MVHRKRHHVVLKYAVLAELPDELAGVVPGDLEDRQASDVCEQGIPHGGREVVELCEALCRQHEAGPELAELAQHRLVVYAGHRLHLVDDDQRAAPLLRREASLLAYHGIHQVEQRRADEGGHVPSDDSLGGGDEQDAAVEDGAAHVDGGAGLADDGPRPLGRCVVGEAGLHRGERLGLVLVTPLAEVPCPPLKQVGVGDLLQDALAEGVEREKGQRVQHGVLPVLVRLRVLVGLVEGLYGLFEDRLHPRPPLVPQALRHAHYRVGGAVAVGEDAGVEQVDAGSAPVVRQVDETHPAGYLFGDVLQQSSHEVCVGIDDDDGVSVPALGLLTHLVRHQVVHESGLAHAGAGDVEVVAVEQVVGEPDGPGLARRGVSHQSSFLHASRRG